jgi:hypothetical protein
MADPIKIKKSHDGELRSELHAKPGQKLSEAKLEKDATKAKKDGNAKEYHQIIFAENSRKWARK